jgi:Nucleotidyl transferase AbiEii toxin, Type IV TA system
VKKGYATPQAMEEAIRAKARLIARELGVTPGDLVVRFYFQRLLARVFQEDGWMLKGGQALLVRYPGQARSSRDADLFRQVTDEITEAVAALERAAGRDLDDYFTFVPVSTESEGNSAKVKLEVLIGRRSKAIISIDLVVKRTPTAEPTLARLEPIVGIDWPDTWPEVLLYPLPDHIADKICAMYEQHERNDGRRVPSTRFRDLGDLLLISQQEVIGGRAVQFALASELPRRRAIPGISLTLPASFEVPDQESWARGYPKAAMEITGLRGCRSLREAAAAAEVFISPLLGVGDPGFWDPSTALWKPR